MGRYRVVSVMAVAFAVGGVVAALSPPWWAIVLLGGSAGWHADNLARWIGKVKP